MRLSALITPLLALATCLAANAQRYCNPLPMPIGQGGNASGDVTVLEEGGKYYMCCTGGGMWVSDNLLDWEFHAVEHIPVAPDLVKYKGRFYLTRGPSARPLHGPRPFQEHRSGRKRLERRLRHQDLCR